MASIYDLAANYEVEPEGLGMTRAPVQAAAPMPAAPTAPVQAAPMPVAPAAPVTAAPRPMGTNPRIDQLGTLLERYFPQGEDYGAELKTARETYNKEAEAFKTMLEKALSPQPKGDDRLGKAEMYFRLAAAFGAPTKTGDFMESLGKAGEVSADILKERRSSARESQQRNLQLALEAQKLRMGAAKEDLVTLRGLAAEGLKDKRTIASELIKEYVRSGQPESAAGKQAKDEGLVPGTPEYQARVVALGEMNVDKQMAQINATMANMTNAQANLMLAQQRFAFQEGQAAKLTGPELKLKTDTEDLIAQTESAYANLKRALELNPNTFDASAVDMAQRTALELVGSKDPKLMNTRELENLLERAALSQLKATFPGAISNDERKALMDTQGLAAKSIEERKRIMENAARAMRGIYLRSRKRLNEINQGLYRNTELGGGLE